MAAEFEDLEFDDSKIIASLTKIKTLVTDIGSANEDVSADLKKSYEEIGGTVSDVEAEMKRLQAEVKAHVANSKKATQENVNFSKSMKDVIGDVKVFGVSIGGTVEQLKGKAQAMKAVAQSVNVGSKSLQLFKIALISTGIGAIVVLLGSLVAWFAKTQKGVDLASKGMAALGAVVTVLMDRFIKIGGAIVKVFQGDFTGAMNDAKGAVTGLTTEINKEIKAAIELESRVQKLRDVHRALGVETAQSRLQIKQLNLTVEDTTKSIKDRLAAAQEAGKIETGLLEKRLAAEKEELQILLDKQALKENELSQDSDEIAEARIKLAQTESESLELQTTLQNKKNGLLAEQQARIQAAVDAQRQLRQEIEDGVKAIQDQALEAEKLQLSPEERLLLEADLARKLFNQQVAALEKKAKQNGIEIDLEKEKAAVLYAIGLETQRKLDELINKGITSIETKIGKVKSLNPTDLAKGILDIKPGEFTEALDKSGEPLFDAFDRFKDKLFGTGEAGEENFQQFADAMSQALGSIFDGLTTKINSQIEENQAWIDDIRAKQEELEEVLDLEEKRRDEGLAHNLTGKEEELAELKKKEEAALKEQAELRKKAATLQLLQDGATQVSNMATAASGIIKGFAEVPIVGIALGIAAVASMFAFFAATKAKSKEAARGYEGGFLGDILGPTAATEDEPHRGKGTYIHPQLIANAREYLVNGDSTLANMDHLDKVNSGIYDNVDLDRFLSQFSPEEISQGFSHRQALADGYGAISATRIIRQTVRGAMGEYSNAVVRAIKERPEHIAVGPHDKIRTYQGLNLIEVTPV